MSKDCERVHLLCTQLPTFQFPFNANEMPRNGIYILFEVGETAHGTDRIVRVGTHTGQDQLRARLNQHFVKENKDRSIFRKNIGRAMLNREADPFLAQWEIDLTTRQARQNLVAQIDVAKQREIEQRVTSYMRCGFKFAVFQVDSKADRLHWESKLISTVSRCEECRPSKDWLGFHSPKPQIRESGLWLVNELYKEPLDEDDIRRLEQLFSAARPH
jgi:hypothetical protein